MWSPTIDGVRIDLNPLATVLVLDETRSGFEIIQPPCREAALLIDLPKIIVIGYTEIDPFVGLADNGRVEQLRSLTNMETFDPVLPTARD